MPDFTMKSFDEWAAERRKMGLPATQAAYKQSMTPPDAGSPVQMPRYGGGINPGPMGNPFAAGMGMGSGYQSAPGFGPVGTVGGPSGGSVPVFGPAPQSPANKGFVGGVNDWLNENLGGGVTDVLGLGLGAYGMYQQGKAQDRQQDFVERQAAEDRGRYEDERKRKSRASAEMAPYVAGIWEELQKQLERTAGGR
jgi:hypothetical protein